MDISNDIEGNSAKAADIPTPKKVRIKSTDRKTFADGTSKVLAHLEGLPKPLYLNKTNLRKLTEIHGGSKNTLDWIEPFYVYATQVQGPNGICPGVRIRSVEEQELMDALAKTRRETYARQDAKHAATAPQSSRASNEPPPPDLADRNDADDFDPLA